MKVSIITVCYNSAITLESTILSVRDQTYTDIEYIIIDGSSSDGTLEIIKSYSQVISQFISESDNGLYHAMNKGISIASGELIGILNSDDVFLTATVIEEIVDFHKKHRIDATIGNIVQCNKSGKVVRFYSSKDWDPNELRYGLMPPHPSLFVRRELFLKYGSYNLGFKIGADYELITRLFLRIGINWKYSGITTTSMLVGGISSSGYSSYKVITGEIKKSLKMNGISFSSWMINIRFIWKIKNFITR